MSNKGKLLGFGALGLALLASSKKASSKTLVQDIAPVSLLNINTELDAVLNIIKNNGAVRTLLKGEKGDTGATGATGANGVSPSVGNHTFGTGEITLGKNSDNNSLLKLAGQAKNYWIYNYNSELRIYTINPDNTGFVPLIQILSDGTVSKIGGGSFSALSDERLKENVEVFANGLEKVLAIETKTFNYKKVEGTQTEFYPDSLIQKKQYGVIAQQIQTVCPEMVKEGEDGFLTVDLSNLSLLLVNAVKELNKKDTDQQKLITSQSAKIKALEEQQALILERLTALEAK